ncbi:hypothetical protein BGZ99_005785 [Dissophora globulifera]|uniref:DUF4142 domain-containing protein n=1 Tax=Dissophora globulifera TaxID=979702 RepID=A0A9P6UT00_9FUNG|nr:hypothetical protein BGZ99_005785 [Dissophora globulifera]
MVKVFSFLVLSFITILVHSKDVLAHNKTRNYDSTGSNVTIAGVERNCPPPAGVVDDAVWDTEWGPVTAADRLLVRKVRLASLWELPMAQEAIQRAQGARVRQISATIEAQHVFLDSAVRSVGQQLGIDLPTEPNSQQKCFINDMESRSGHDYDVTYVKWLRFAHGQIFELTGTVRSTTQNSVVRSFAETANLFVLGHMQMLESTGFTANSSFPVAPPVMH